MSAPTSAGDASRLAALRRMRIVATAMLGVAAAVFVATRVAHANGNEATWLGYVEAAAEAALVGGLADWFAVVALFRHPLRLPIPHTAIVQKRKDEIGTNLGTFVQENFLAPKQLAERVASLDPVGRAVTWVREDPEHSDRVAAGLLRALMTLSDSVDDAEVSSFLHDVLSEQVRSVPAAPVVARALELGLADGRRDQVADAVLGGVLRVLDSNREPLRQRFATESPWWVPEGIDERVFTRLFDGIRRLMADMRADPRHELRTHLNSQLDVFITNLRTDPLLMARVEGLRDEFLSHQAVRTWTVSAWQSARAELQRAANVEDRSASTIRLRLGAAIGRAADRLADDPGLRMRADNAIQRAVAAGASRGGREMADIIASTVKRWNAADTGRRIELQIGRDLQFIRINGTIVGGLAGLLIHGVGQLL
jgi:uncharacterized membrane-anchored protein YjiN (DUF445 family)